MLKFDVVRFSKVNDEFTIRNLESFNPDQSVYNFVRYINNDFKKKKIIFTLKVIQSNIIRIKYLLVLKHRQCKQNK